MRGCKLALAFGALVLLSSPALAQRGMGRGGLGPAQLVQNKSVQEELKIDLGVHSLLPVGQNRYLGGDHEGTLGGRDLVGRSPGRSAMRGNGGLGSLDVDCRLLAGVTWAGAGARLDDRPARSRPP